MDAGLVLSKRLSNKFCNVSMNQVSKRIAGGGFIYQLGLLMLIVIVTAIPFSESFATSSIARRVELFCAPNPTSPDVASCSSCHSSINNRGTGDLTTAGRWSLSQSTFSQFCPAANTPTPPTPNPTPTPTPPPPSGMGMGTGTGSTGMGMGVGGSIDDDDDDDGDHDDDDDDMEDHDDDDDDSFVSQTRRTFRALSRRIRGD